VPALIVLMFSLVFCFRGTSFIYSWKFFCFVFVSEGKSRLHFGEDFGLGLTSFLSSVCTELALKVFNFRPSMRSDK